MPRGARAFSLVEAVISTVIVATMFAAALSAGGVAARDRRIQAEQRTGAALANLLMSEILAQRYADPAGGTVLGLESGEPAETRAKWDDVDDYNGLTDTIRDRDGNAVEGMDGWKWSAKVEYFTIPALDGVTSHTSSNGSLVIAVPLLGIRISLTTPSLAAAADTGVKRITVTVISPRKTVATLVGLRSAWGAPNETATGSGAVIWTGLAVQVGDDARTVSVGTEMLNRPQP